MQSDSTSFSPIDTLVALLQGKNSSVQGLKVISVGENGVVGNKEMVMILTTSLALFVGCVVFLVWRKLSGPTGTGMTCKSAKPLNVLKKLDVNDLEIDDGTKKVTVFFGTQTGTAEGFAKVTPPLFHIVVAVFFCVFSPDYYCSFSDRQWLTKPKCDMKRQHSK